MSYLTLKTIAGQTFVTMKNGSGKTVTEPTQAAIARIKQEVAGLQSQLTGLRIAFDDNAQSLRRALIGGGDTQAIREAESSLQARKNSLEREISWHQNAVKRIQAAITQSRADQLVAEAEQAISQLNNQFSLEQFV